MKTSRLISVLIVASAAISVARVADASMTERLEGRFLKSRIKMRIDENWKIQSGNTSEAQATAFDDSTWTVTNVPHDFSIALVKPTSNDPGANGWT